MSFAILLALCEFEGIASKNSEQDHQFQFRISEISESAIQCN